MNGFPTKTIEAVTLDLIDYRGKTPTKTADGVKLITAKVVKDGFIQDGEHEYIAESDYDAWMRRGLPKQWDILITTEAPLGEVAQLRTPERIALAQRIILLRGDPNLIDQAYYFHALKSPFVQSGLKARSSGTTVLGIKQSELRQVEIPYPPLPIQQRIASILSAYDDLIENNTRRIMILEDMARMLYREWFVNFRFPGHRKVKFVESELGPIPEGWKLSDFGSLSINLDSKRIPLSKMQRASHDRRYAYYGASGIIDKVESYLFDGLHLLISEDGENLRSRKTPISFLADGKFWVNNHAHVVQGRPPVSTLYLFACLKTTDISPYLTGTAQPKLSQANLNRIPVLRPRDAVLRAFEALHTPILTLVDALVRKNANLRTTRDFLLPKLMSGEISVEAAAELVEQTA
jgi:type I restriction enzyme S subunit